MFRLHQKNNNNHQKSPKNKPQHPHKTPQTIHKQQQINKANPNQTIIYYENLKLFVTYVSCWLKVQNAVGWCGVGPGFILIISTS